MSYEKLVKYIKSQLNSGFTDEQIQDVLEKNGYKQEVIQEAFLQVHMVPHLEAPKDYPKEKLEEISKKRKKMYGEEENNWDDFTDELHREEAGKAGLVGDSGENEEALFQVDDEEELFVDDDIHEFNDNDSFGMSKKEFEKVRRGEKAEKLEKLEKLEKREKREKVEKREKKNVKSVKESKSHHELPSFQNTPAKYNTLALIGFFFSMTVVLAIIGFIISGLSLHQMKGRKRHEKGKGLALAGMIIGFIFVAVPIVLVLMFFNEVGQYLM